MLHQTLKNAVSLSESSSLRVSLPTSEEIIKSKEELQKMVFIKAIFGNVSVHSLTRALPEILHSNHLVIVTPFDENFILTMNSANFKKRHCHF